MTFTKSELYQKYINYMIIGYAIALPTSKAGISFFEILIITMWVVQGDFRYKLQEILKSKVILTLILFIVLSYISIFWSSNPVFAFPYMEKYWHFLVIPAIYTSLDLRYARSILSGFLLGMLASEILSYGIFFELVQYRDVLPSDPSPFMNHANYSLFLSMASLILLNRIFFASEVKYKLFYILYFTSTVTNLFINGGRTGQVIFILSILTAFILQFEHKLKAVLISSTLLIFIFTLAYNYSPVFQDRGVRGYYDIKQSLLEQNYDDSFGQRVGLWIMGVNVAMYNLPFGTGVGDEKMGMQEYAIEHNITRVIGWEDSGYIDYHNNYIQYFVQLGIPGLLLMFFLKYSLFTLQYKSLYFKRISIIFALSISIFSTVGLLLHIMFPMTFFAFFTAYMIGVSRAEMQSGVQALQTSK